ncbi:MbtH family protein [Streptomyces lonarensis]|uniref:MbtH family protein n=1 Tax=Streptomyces lonarensis TaxID=700599 RepID=A0A7X6I1I4_9ACTN|nr:MbtH family protein [Streptomyces lonarensis]NJQ08384.1 MbtH family protein [Streptomyces lonarensis]
MTNPFDDNDGTFHVVVNDEEQHAIWPTFAEVPAGWRIVREAGGRAESLAWIEEHWTDIRPAGLRAQYA